MKKVIITGATGTVGGIMLQECLQSTELGKAIFEAGIKGAEKTILENRDIKESLEDKGF